MKKIIHFSQNNKLAIWLFALIVIASGFYSGLQMKNETLPDLNIPVVTVTTIFPGASPQQVADKLTDPMEQRIKNLEGVETVSSTSLSNASSLVVEYDYEKDMSEAVAQLNEEIAKVDLPTGAQDPTVAKISFDALPVFTANVAGDGKSIEDITRLVEDQLIPTLQGIDGVADVTVAGQQIEEVELVWDQKALKKYQLDEETAKAILQGSAIKFPLGIYGLEKEEVSVVVDGNVASLKQLRNVILPNAEHPDLQLKDVATLSVVKQTESISRTNGKETVSFSLSKARDANTVDLVNEAKEEIESFESANAGTTVTTTLDQGETIEKSIFTMLEKALIGAGFAIVIILLFLRDLRSTVIAVVSIPLSLLSAILILKQLDITLNMMTLGALTVAIGRVIDDSIVVIENIHRRMALRAEKLTGKDLITASTIEMFIPILSSTVVTVIVFLPLVLVKGAVGELFRPFALTVGFALAASLLVAITVVPMMAHLLFKQTKQVGEETSAAPSALAKGYRKFLSWTLNHKWITSFAAVLLLVSSLGLAPKIGFSFLAADTYPMFVATYEPDPGQKKEAIEKTAEEVEAYFLDNKEIEVVEYTFGTNNPMNPTANDQVSFHVEYKEDVDDFTAEKEQVEKDLKAFSAKGTWSIQGVSDGMSDNSLTLYVYGTDREEVEPVVEEILSLVDKQGDFEHASSSLNKTFKEYTFQVDQKKASQLGLTAAQVGMALSQFDTKEVLTTVTENGKEFEVSVPLASKDYDTIDELANERVETPFGTQVKVKDLVTIEEGKATDSITKRDGKFYVAVTADFKTDDIGQASADLQKEIDAINLPANVDVDFGGVTEQMQDAFGQLGLAILLAVIIVYLVLVITFGGGLAPFAILFSLPFTVIGALVALYLSGQTIDVTTLIGMLMLIGIVVTNAIVLIHRVIHMEQDGLTTREALLEAGLTRLRPILMTAIATIGALVPLAIGSGDGGVVSKALGITVIGGLISSTLLTLIMVPIVYETLMNLKHRPKKKKKKRTMNEKTWTCSCGVENTTDLNDPRDFEATEHADQFLIVCGGCGEEKQVSFELKVNK